MSGHTPGPWRHEGVDAFGDHTIARKGNLAIAAVVSNLRSASEVAANARLISAAPELLEAARKLEMVVRLGIPQKAVPLIAEHGLWDEFVEARIRIEEAINKAEGRE